MNKEKDQILLEKFSSKEGKTNLSLSLWEALFQKPKHVQDKIILEKKDFKDLIEFSRLK